MQHPPLPGSVELMAEIAQPLDDWCEFCNLKLAVGHTADGVGACAGCMEEVVEAMRKYEAEAIEAESGPRVRFDDRGRQIKVTAGAAKARAKRRAKRKRTKR